MTFLAIVVGHILYHYNIGSVPLIDDILVLVI